jgi:hypothetical protein
VSRLLAINLVLVGLVLGLLWASIGWLSPGVGHAAELSASTAASCQDWAVRLHVFAKGRWKKGGGIGYVAKRAFDVPPGWEPDGYLPVADYNNPDFIFHTVFLKKCLDTGGGAAATQAQLDPERERREHALKAEQQRIGAAVTGDVVMLGSLDSRNAAEKAFARWAGKQVVVYQLDGTTVTGRLSLFRGTSLSLVLEDRSFWSGSILNLAAARLK